MEKAETLPFEELRDIYESGLATLKKLEKNYTSAKLNYK